MDLQPTTSLITFQGFHFYPAHGSHTTTVRDCRPARFFRPVTVVTVLNAREHCRAHWALCASRSLTLCSAHPHSSPYHHTLLVQFLSHNDPHTCSFFISYRFTHFHAFFQHFIHTSCMVFRTPILFYFTIRYYCDRVAHTHPLVFKLFTHIPHPTEDERTPTGV